MAYCCKGHTAHCFSFPIWCSYTGAFSNQNMGLVTGDWLGTLLGAKKGENAYDPAALMIMEVL